jgi:Spy/CpxP family protein refolding chaperone
MKHVIILAGMAVSMLAVPAGPAGAASPYAGEQQREIKALSAEERADLAAGRGMGLAKAAELNGYPGPLHVLELAEALGLSERQRAETQALLESMRAKARTLGAALLDAERALDGAFADKRVDGDSLRARLAEIARLQGELRFVHLEAHLAQRALLTPAQAARYDVLRGYAASDAPASPPVHDGHGHRRH